jgi:hypothetical protein
MVRRNNQYTSNTIFDPIFTKSTEQGKSPIHAHGTLKRVGFNYCRHFNTSNDNDTQSRDCGASRTLFYLHVARALAQPMCSKANTKYKLATC